MKKLNFYFIILLAFISFTSTSFGQTIKKNKTKDVLSISLPTNPLPKNVKTFSFELETNTIDFSSLSYDKKTLLGYMLLPGYKYNSQNPDIIFKVTIDEATPIYKAQENKTTKQWDGIIDFNIKTEIIATLKDGKEFMKYEIQASDVKLFTTVPGIKTGNELQAKIEMQKDKNKILSEALDRKLSGIYNEIRRRQYSKFGYVTSSDDLIISTFKKAKEFDVKPWQKHAEHANECIVEITKGTSVDDAFAKMKEDIDFWKNEINNSTQDDKTGVKKISVAVFNLIQIFSKTFKTDEAVDLLNKYDDIIVNKLKINKQELEDLNNRVQANIDRKEMISECYKTIPVYRERHYEGLLVDKKGNEKEMIFYFDQPFMADPTINCLHINCIDKKLYLDCNGQYKQSDREKIVAKDVTSYKIGDIIFEAHKITDITSLTPIIYFMEPVIEGKIKLYNYYFQPSEEEEDRMTISDMKKAMNKGEVREQHAPVKRGSKIYPNIILNKPSDKKPKYEVINNYNALALLVEDNQEIHQKVINGDYGNPPVKQKSSKLGKLANKGNVVFIDNKIIHKVVEEYNAK